MAVRRLLARFWVRMLGTSIGYVVTDKAKAGWFGLLRMLGLVRPTLSWSGVEPRVSAGTINLRRWPSPAPAATHYSPSPHATESVDKVLRVLQQRAAWDLFDWLDVEQVPVAYWQILRTLPDPAEALTTFIRRLHLDPNKVRGRDPDEMSAFRNHVAFICQIERQPDSATEKQRLELERMFYFGDVEAAKAALEVFIDLNEAIEEFENSPGPPRFQVFERLVGEVRQLRARGTRIARDEAAEALSLAQHYAKVMRRFDETGKGRAKILEAIAAHWDDWAASEEETHIRDGMIAKAASLEDALLSQEDVNIRTVLETFELCVKDLGDLVEEVARRAREAAAAAAAEEARRREESHHKERAERKSPGGESAEGEAKGRDWRGREAHSMSLSELLAFFGFAEDYKPSPEAIRIVFRQKAQECFPYPDAPDYRARNEQYRQLLDVFKRLKSACA